MANFDTTEADGVLKEFYLLAIRSQINNKTPVLDVIERSNEHVEGSEWVLSLHVERNSGVGARRENETLPTAGRQGTTKAREETKQNTARFELTTKVMKALNSDKGGFTKAVTFNTDETINDVRRDVNRQAFGTSNGVIATCGDTVTSDTVVLATTTGSHAIRQLEKGMVIDIGTVAAPTTVASARTIESVDRANKTITISGANVSTTAGTHFIFRAGSGGASGGVGQAEIHGLQHIADDDSTLFNVNPSTYEKWAATVLGNSGTPRAVTEEIFEEAMDEVDLVSGETPDLFWCSYGVFREYGDQMKTLKRFPNTLELKGGHKALDISSGDETAGLKRDRDCPDGMAIGWVTKHMFSPEMSDWEWMDQDGAVLSRVSDKTNYEATLEKFHDLCTDKRNTLVRIEDLAE